MTRDYEPSPPNLPQKTYLKYKERRIKYAQDVLDLVEKLKDKGIDPNDIRIMASGEDEDDLIVTAEWTETLNLTEEEYKKCMEQYTEKMVLYAKLAKEYYKKRLEQLEAGQY